IIIYSCDARGGANGPVQWPDTKVPVVKPYLCCIHDDSVVDNYYWLSDYFKQGPDSAVVIKYLEVENTYTKNMMADTEEFHNTLFEELKGRIKETDESVPPSVTNLNIPALDNIKEYNFVTDFGAIGNNQHDNFSALQQAILKSANEPIR